MIENCLRANAVLRRELPHSVNNPSCGDSPGGKPNGLGARKESPIFDPSHYLSDGYPHLRARVKDANSGEFWGFRGMGNNCGQRIGTKMGDSPIFMGKTRSGLSRSRPSRVRS